MNFATFICSSFEIQSVQNLQLIFAKIRGIVMLNNYQYFIALAEEENISRAADRLFISHQCLSKYLKNLEQEYRVAFFERTPRLKLNVAGEAMLEMCRKVQFLEQNLESKLEDVRQSKRGLIRLGTTEGRYRIMFPDLLVKFKEMYPDVTLQVSYATSSQLTEKLLKNELDVILMNRSFVGHAQLDIAPLLEERMFLVISDNMLAKYLPDMYPECLETFSTEGVDLALMKDVPFILNKRSFNSRIMLDNFLAANGLHINCVMELTQLDLHFMMSRRDYAASFCWSMYLPTIRNMNRLDPEHALNVFPIKGLDERNHIVLVTQKGKILPEFGKNLIKLIRKSCAKYENMTV